MFDQVATSKICLDVYMCQMVGIQHKFETKIMIFLFSFLKFEVYLLSLGYYQNSFCRSIQRCLRASLTFWGNIL